MTTDDIDELRSLIRQDTDALADLYDERDQLRDRTKIVSADIKSSAQRRERRIKRARDAGADPQDLAADAGLTVTRIRQIAPLPGRTASRPRRVTPPTPKQQPTEQAADQPQQEQEGEELSAPQAAAATQLFAAAVAEVTRTASTARENRPRTTTPRGPFSIPERVEQVLQACGGDADAATRALIKSAIPDAMQLLDQSRAGARYDYTAHPSIPDPLKRPGRRESDQIWEGRPSFRNSKPGPGWQVTRFDINGAYLAALRRVHLPIGRLVNDRTEGRDPAVFDLRRAGIYLIDPPQWDHGGLPNPLGDGREESGPVWVTTSTLRLLLRASNKLNLCEQPKILDSWTSGSSEILLGAFGDELAQARRTAIAAGDDVTEAYVKAMYSKWVSTAGDSRANHEIFRPDWVHSIRSQAFANLWYKAHAVWAHDLAGVYRMSGTDELHVFGAWREIKRPNGSPLFTEGRDLAEVKVKSTYVLGGPDDRTRDRA